MTETRVLCGRTCRNTAPCTPAIRAARLRHTVLSPHGLLVTGVSPPSRPIRLPAPRGEPPEPDRLD